MKKYLLHTLWALLAVAVFMPLVSCSDDDEEVKKYNVSITLQAPEGVELSNIENLALVTVHNNVTDTIALQPTATQSVALVPGQYTFAVNGQLKDQDSWHVVGTASVDVLQQDGQAVTIQLEKVQQSPLIFKAIYTTGGKQGYVVDGYYEIVNNSNEVQYLDGVIISAPTGNQSKENAWQAAGITDLYESGQGSVVAFPGTGKDYPLQPGQSVVVANDAANHSELAPEGNNCPDLSKADWEIYLDYASGETDYAAPNLDVIFHNNNFMKAFGLGFFGRGYILAKLPAGTTPAQFAADPANIQTTPNTTSTMQFLMIPSKYVLDAVDIWNGERETHYSTFLSADDQQGVNASTAWAGKCVRRKVTRIAGGRAYYQDTNNSANDFLNNQPLTPGQAPTAVDN